MLIQQDCPEGHESKIEMVKQSNCCLCRPCYYCKRGSLGNMKLSELVTNLNENENFSDKFLGFVSAAMF